MLAWLVDHYNRAWEFVELGGIVLFVIGIVIFCMWTLIMERILYYNLGYRKYFRQTLSQWYDRRDRLSWNAQQIRWAMISQVRQQLNRGLPIIQTFVAICPLLGLFGTVNGMIEVFDVMAYLGTGNPRSMASGVSKATIPTMAGMVGALSGLFAITYLRRFARRQSELIEDRLIMDE